MKTSKWSKLSAFVAMALAASAATANFFWDGGMVTVNGRAEGGSGVWNVHLDGWENGANPVNWANDNTAILGGAPGTLTLGGAITAAGIVVDGIFSIAGAHALTAGALSLAANAELTITNGTAAFSFSGLSGSGRLLITKGASNSNIAALNSANALNYTGVLALRGGSTTTVPGAVANHWLAFSGANLTQAAGTAFALDTGASSTNGKDLVLGDGFNGRSLNLSALTGHGALRVDWGGTANATVTRTIHVNQTSTSVFNGPILSHTSWVNGVRAISFIKDGTGTLTLAGIVGQQTALAGTVPAPVALEVRGGTLIMTASNTTTTGAIAIRNGGTLRMNNADAGLEFSAGNQAMTNAYTVDQGGRLVGFRNGRSVFGQGPIILNGGVLAQEQGQWTWTSNIILNPETLSTIESQASNTGTRYLKLQGIVSGNGNLTFSDTTDGMGLDTGFIFTGSNTLSGTITIPVNRKVRVGGVPGDSMDLAAGPGGCLGTAAIVNNGMLTFSRSDAHVFANAISGSGGVRVGSTGIPHSETQTLTLSGVNAYTGGTSVNTGALLVNGAHTGGSLYDVAANATFGGAGTVQVAQDGMISAQANARLAPGSAPGQGGALTLNRLTMQENATLVIDHPDDRVLVTDNLVLNNNPVMLSNHVALTLDKRTPIAILTASGGLSGSLAPGRIPETDWFVRQIGNAFYIEHRVGTVLKLR